MDNENGISIYKRTKPFLNAKQNKNKRLQWAEEKLSLTVDY